MKWIVIFLSASILTAAEPDWPQLEKTALELLQQYVRIQSVDPPADTAAAASFIKGILERDNIPVRLLTSGPNGQTNLVARLSGRDRRCRGWVDR